MGTANWQKERNIKGNNQLAAMMTTLANMDSSGGSWK